jgi:hypothetical protein
MLTLDIGLLVGKTVIDLQLVKNKMAIRQKNLNLLILVLKFFEII